MHQNNKFESFMRKTGAHSPSLFHLSEVKGENNRATETECEYQLHSDA
jgi:hypothetical protein